jgi:hypothetical protein
MLICQTLEREQRRKSIAKWGRESTPFLPLFSHLHCKSIKVRVSMVIKVHSSSALLAKGGAWNV